MRLRERRAGRRTRRAAVIVQVAMFSTVMIGMGALAVDIGTMYTTRTELQAAVDAAALAAAAQLAGDGENTPQSLVNSTADQFARLNAVFGTYAGVDPNTDIEMGQAEYDAATGRFTFTPGGTNFDAVRVTVRRSEGSEGGPLPMMFSHLFGYTHKNLWATATAVLIPRDIAVVIDLSGSMNDDSELRHYKQFYGDQGDLRDGVQINLRDCWAALDGPAPQRPYFPGPESETEYSGDNGPSVGSMTLWGEEITPESYDPTTDSGLWYIPRNSTCTNSAANSALQARGYTADEISKLMSGSSDGGYSRQWRNRSAVITGLASWRSGRPGGQAGGDGDSYVEDSEITWISYPSYRGAGTWTWANFVDYVGSNSSQMYSTQPSFRYRFGLKTYTNFLLEKYPSYSATNNLWQTPEQPLRAVKDAVQAMVDQITALQSLDRMSLEIFAQTPRHEVDLTDNLQSVSERLYHMQAAHYDSTTNIGGGISYAIDELNSARARAAARKVMVVMSDGKPNVNSSNQYVGDDDPGVYAYSIAMAQAAADDGITIYTVSVGQDVDVDLMEEIAQIGRGQHFHATGTPDEYQDQLEQIFRTLGGRRPVALIE